MRNFLRGVGVGVVVAYVFHDNLDEALRKGLTKANEIVDGKPKQGPEGVTSS